MPETIYPVEVFANVQGPQIPDPLYINVIVTHSISSGVVSATDMWANSLTANYLQVVSGADIAFSGGNVSIGLSGGLEKLTIAPGYRFGMQLAPVTGVTTGYSNSVSSTLSGINFWRVVACDGINQTQSVTSVSANVTNTGLSAVIISWKPSAGAVFYKVYRSTFNTPITSISSAFTASTTSYVDSGWTGVTDSITSLDYTNRAFSVLFSSDSSWINSPIVLLNGRVGIGSLFTPEKLTISSNNVSGNIVSFSSSSLTGGIRLTNDSSSATWNLAVVGSTTGSRFGTPGSLILYNELFDNVTGSASASKSGQFSSFLMVTTGGMYSIGSTGNVRTFDIFSSNTGEHQTFYVLKSVSSDYVMSGLTGAVIKIDVAGTGTMASGVVGFMVSTNYGKTKPLSAELISSYSILALTGSASSMTSMINNVSEMRFIAPSTGFVLSAYNYLSRVSNSSSTVSICNPYGFFHRKWPTALIPYGSTAWSFYAEADPAYFGSYVTLGTTSLSATLHVQGSISADSISTNNVRSQSLTSNSISSTSLTTLSISAFSITSTNLSSITANFGTVSAAAITSFGVCSTSGNFSHINSNSLNVFSVCAITGWLQSVYVNNLNQINGIKYSWPGTQGAANTFLKNDGAGSLSWGAGGGGGGGATGRSYAANPGDKPPSVSSSYDDEFEDVTLDAKWVQTNWGASTSAWTTAGSLIIRDPGSANPAVRILAQTLVTSSTWNITAKVSGNLKTIAFQQVGIVVRNNTTGRMMSYTFNTNNTDRLLYINKWNSYGSYNADVLDGAATNNSGIAPVYLRIQRDSTNISFWASSDGISWNQIFSETRTTFIESTNVIDRIGLMLNVQNTTLTAQGSYAWFRKDWTADWDPKVDS